VVSHTDTLLRYNNISPFNNSNRIVPINFGHFLLIDVIINQYRREWIIRAYGAIVEWRRVVINVKRFCR
jgi:hypothetical protein